MYTNKIQKLLDRQQISQLVEVVVECNSETITGIIILLLLLFIYLFFFYLQAVKFVGSLIEILIKDSE